MTIYFHKIFPIWKQSIFIWYLFLKGRSLWYFSLVILVICFLISTKKLQMRMHLYRFSCIKVTKYIVFIYQIHSKFSFKPSEFSLLFTCSVDQMSRWNWFLEFITQIIKKLKLEPHLFGNWKSWKIFHLKLFGRSYNNKYFFNVYIHSGTGFNVKKNRKINFIPLG